VQYEVGQSAMEDWCDLGRPSSCNISQLASCLIYARALLEYVIFILWVRSVSKMLLSVKLAEYKVLTFLILRERC